MDLSLSILFVTLIHLSYAETEIKITERTALGDLLGEKVNFTHKVDTCKGIVAARFYLPKSSSYTNYSIELENFNNINNETCLGNISNEETHSTKMLDSTEDEEVIFRHVFSGCYRWKIKPYINTTSYPDLYTDLIYIVTNAKRKITKEDIRVPNPTHNCKNSSLEVKVYLHFIPEKIIIKQGNLPFEPTSTEYSCGTHATHQAECVLFVNGSSTCNAENDIALPECRKFSSQKDADSICPNDVSEGIRCTFFNVTPGNYCIWALVEDVRCGRDSIFKCDHPCTWSFMQNIVECFHDIAEVNLNSLSAFSLSLVIIVTIISLFFFGVIVYMFKRKPPMIHRLDEPKDETLPMVTRKKVLLLYARDCEQFMTVMKSFGQLLEKSLNIKVYDCYSDEDVLDGPLDWLQNKLRNPQFYTLIVTTRCAYLHQEAILAGDWGDSYSLYREPSFLDRVFIYGLKWVMKDISANPFSKNYIIGFRGFSNDEDMLSLPTNWRRYIIPDHLDQLLTDMDIYCSPAENIKNTVQHVCLESDIHSLCKYKSQNPYYLDGILRSDGILKLS